MYSVSVVLKVKDHSLVINNNPVTSLFFFFNPPCASVCLSGEAFEQSPIRRSFKSKVLVHYPESTDRMPLNKDAVNMVRHWIRVVHVLSQQWTDKTCLVCRANVLWPFQSAAYVNIVTSDKRGT